MQNYEARAELAQLMLVSRNIVSPQSNKPVMKIVQDSLLAARLITRRDTFINKRDMMGLCMHLREFDGTLPPPAIFKPVPLWTGKQVRASSATIASSVCPAPLKSCHREVTLRHQQSDGTHSAAK